MSDSISLSFDDVLISRVNNGWILRIQEESIDGDTFVKTHVYEDEQYGENASSEALSHCLWEAFQEYTRTKRQGGITFEVKDPLIKSTKSIKDNKDNKEIKNPVVKLTNKIKK